jgi:hypothetical protein
MENAALSLNLSGRKMRPKDRREITIALYEQCGWGYGRISRAIGDNNKSNVQRWITTHKMKLFEMYRHKVCRAFAASERRDTKFQRRRHHE